MKSLFKVTNSKSKIIVSSILAIISLIFICYLISYFGLLHREKPFLNELLYPVYSGYNGFNNAFISFIIIGVVYLLLTPMICMKKSLSVKCMIIVYVVLFIFSIVLSVTFSTQFTSKNVCSYTEDVENYGAYDDIKLDDSFNNYLPSKEKVIRYQYKAINNLATNDDLKYQSVANIMIYYDDEIYNDIINDGSIEKIDIEKKYQENISNIEEYEFYRVTKSHYHLTITINKDFDVIVYSLHTDYFKLFDKNNDFIVKFILGQNTKPYN